MGLMCPLSDPKSMAPNGRPMGSVVNKRRSSWWTAAQLATGRTIDLDPGRPIGPEYSIGNRTALRPSDWPRFGTKSCKDGVSSTQHPLPLPMGQKRVQYGFVPSSCFLCMCLLPSDPPRRFAGWDARHCKTRRRKLLTGPCHSIHFPISVSHEHLPTPPPLTLPHLPTSRLLMTMMMTTTTTTAGVIRQSRNPCCSIIRWSHSSRGPR